MAPAATTALDHHKTSVACLPVGHNWRVLRKICKEAMFSTQQLDLSCGLRREKIQKLLNLVEKCCVDRKAMDIGESAFETSLNLISSTLFSVDNETGSSQELKEIIHGLMGVFGRPNLADCFPCLGKFDPQGIKREAEFYMGKLLEIFDGMIDQRLMSSEKKKKNDFLEVLLEISEGDHESEICRHDIKHLLLDLFIAGTDTTSNTVEWTMTELLRNPKILSKAQKELRTVVGENKQVEESDISNLPYLKAVIKETFRYHPPGPFLGRRKDQNDVKINSYTIPKNAIILINIWAIGRDSRTWSNPDSFDPERFLNAEFDAEGHRFDLIPFGGGRRICPGVPLAYRMVHLMVASLIHNFDWKLLEEMNLDDKFGIILHKVLPLMAVPIKL